MDEINNEITIIGHLLSQNYSLREKCKFIYPHFSSLFLLCGVCDFGKDFEIKLRRINFNSKNLHLTNTFYEFGVLDINDNKYISWDNLTEDQISIVFELMINLYFSV